MRFFHPFVFLSFWLFLTGCMTPEEPQTPDWVVHPPEATAQELYGVSVASSLPKTVLSAVGGLASAVYDAAQEPLRKYPLDSLQLQRTRRAMKAVLASLDYDGVEVKKKAPMDKNVAVLIAMERADLITQLTVRLQSHIRRLETEIAANTEGQPFFQRLAVLGKVNEEHAEVLAEIVLLETADPFTDLKPYLAFIERTRSAYDRLKFDASASVISDAGAIAFVVPLKKAFAAEGIGTAYFTQDAKHRGTVLLFADKQQERTQRGYFLKIRLRTKTRARKQILAKSEHYYQKISPENFKTAESAIAETFAADLRNKGLFHTLGF